MTTGVRGDEKCVPSLQKSAAVERALPQWWEITLSLLRNNFHSKARYKRGVLHHGNKVIRLWKWNSNKPHTEPTWAQFSRKSSDCHGVQMRESLVPQHSKQLSKIIRLQKSHRVCQISSASSHLPLCHARLFLLIKGHRQWHPMPVPALPSLKYRILPEWTAVHSQEPRQQLLVSTARLPLSQGPPDLLLDSDLPSVSTPGTAAALSLWTNSLPGTLSACSCSGLLNSPIPTSAIPLLSISGPSSTSAPLHVGTTSL